MALIVSLYTLFLFLTTSALALSPRQVASPITSAPARKPTACPNNLHWLTATHENGSVDRDYCNGEVIDEELP